MGTLLAEQLPFSLGIQDLSCEVESMMPLLAETNAADRVPLV